MPRKNPRPKARKLKLKRSQDVAARVETHHKAAPRFCDPWHGGDLQQAIMAAALALSFKFPRST